MYGDPEEWEDNTHEMNAVDEYLKKRNQGLIGGLGILSYEDERKAQKKAKRKDRDKEKERNKSSKNRPHSHSGTILEDISDNEKKKDRKEKKAKDKDKWRNSDQPPDGKENRKKDKSENKPMRETSASTVMSPDPTDIEKVE